MISKYPPIEGGVSSDNYWVARALGERGHEIFVVTNAWEVEEDYREEIQKSEYNNLEPKNVHLFSTVKDFKSPILKSNYYSEKLISLATQIIRKYNPDIIYSHYILPYSIVGFVTKQITGKKHIMRHAGSDIGRLYKSKFLKPIFIESFKDAEIVFGGKNAIKIFEQEELDKNKIYQVGNNAINPLFFNQEADPFNLQSFMGNLKIPIFTYLGKISELKKTYNFVKAAAEIKNRDFRILFVIGNGIRAQEFKDYITSIGLIEKCIFIPFQPPWKVPSIMRASSCIVSPESEETPYLPKGTHYPKIAREAMACGKCVIIGKDVAQKRIYSNLIDGKNILIVDPNNLKKFKEKLELIIDNPLIAEEIGKKAYEFSRLNENFMKYIKSIEDVMMSLI